MSKDFSLEELRNLIEVKENDSNYGIDEVLLLLAEYIGDKKVLEEVDKHVEMFYASINHSFQYLEETNRKIEEATRKLTEAETILRS